MIMSTFFFRSRNMTSCLQDLSQMMIVPMAIKMSRKKILFFCPLLSKRGMDFPKNY